MCNLANEQVDYRLYNSLSVKQTYYKADVNHWLLTGYRSPGLALWFEDTFANEKSGRTSLIARVLLNKMYLEQGRWFLAKDHTVSLYSPGPPHIVQTIKQIAARTGINIPILYEKRETEVFVSLQK
ncbi:MAG: hypothetical protein DRH08_06575 [Deltaproteobacteria bacterium]|nr:MAG: hypothetical protein DRH08_06575 [Deltaproteobacteria bacterium]